MLKLARLLAVVLSSMVILIVLPSVASAEGCPNEQLRVENRSTQLPECRAYEQVTPAEKGGGIFGFEQMGPGPDGAPDLITDSFADVGDVQSDEGLAGAIYSTVRTGSGWVTSPLQPPASEYQEDVLFNTPNPQAVSLDARSAVWLDSLRSWPTKNRVDLIMTRPGAPVEDIGPVTLPNSPSFVTNGSELTRNLQYAPRGWSDDLSHIVYSQRTGFWPFDSTEEKRETLYEYVGAGHTEPMLVGVSEGGKLISACGTYLGGELDHNAVSADGDTVFFTADQCGSSPPTNELFARIDNGQPDARTVAISEPSAEDCATCNTSQPEEATFLGASVDGTKVFFVTTQPLLGGDNTNNIYEYDFSAPPGERVIRVSGGDSTVSNPKAEVLGVVATAQDGSHVYFVAHGVLTKTPDSSGKVAQAGDDNLYVYEHDTQYPAGHTAFITELSSSDEALWLGNGSDLTPDGRFLVFTSTDDLTSDDTSTVAQVFEYDAQTSNLVRVSIGQNSYNDNGNTSVAPAWIRTPSYGEQSVPTTYLSRLSVAIDGTVFFESTDGLTPRALNHEVIGKHYEGGFEHPEAKFSLVYGNNIYEYHEGNVYLISDGRDVSLDGEGYSDVKLLGTDESGADVLFTTVDQLVPQDTDTDVDIYDARVDGGFTAPTAPQECSGDSCQGPLSPAPTLLSPGSEFQAGGNPPLATSVQTAKPKTKKAAKPKVKRKRKKAKKVSRSHGKAQRHGKGGRS